ncbi:MAG: hypothetical protein JSW05_07835, partial [Candidatus Thorarchaeota archaeon]
MRQVGWLLDASVDYRNQALTLWIKANEKTRGYTYREFKPSVFVSSEQMKGLDWTDTEVFSAVRTHPNVTGTKLE